MDYIRTFNDDPCEGHLSTPISDSPVTRLFINNLPINRPGLSPLLRGSRNWAGPWLFLGRARNCAGAAAGLP
jgi:photosystem I subunit 11